jgi:PST family polysaccharide transporter
MFLQSKRFLLLRDRFSPNFRKIIANTIWLFADRIVQMGLSLFVGLLVARYLGPGQFGFLNYALAFVSLFGAVSNLGLDSIVVREVLRSPTAANQILGTTLVLRLVSAAFTSVIAVVSIFFVRPGDPLTHTLVGILVIGSFFNTFPIDAWFQSQVQSKNVVIAKNTAYVLMCLVRVALVYYKMPLVAFAWAALAENALATIGQVATYHLSRQSIRLWRFNFAQAITLLKSGWPLILSSMVIMIYMRIDQIMLGQLASSEDVGVYSAAVKISEMWYFVPSAIVSSVFPAIIQSREDAGLYRQRLQKLFNLMALLAYVVAIGVTLVATQLINLLYGAAFLETGGVLAIHIWTGLFVSLGLARSPYLIAEDLTRFSAATDALGALVNVVLNYLLIPRYGAVGASVATLIAQVCSAYVTQVLHPKTRLLFFQQTKALLLLDYIRLIPGLRSKYR